MTSEERREARYKRRKKKREDRRKEILEKYGDFYFVSNRNALSKSAQEATKGVKYKASVQRFMIRQITNVAYLNKRLIRGKDIRKGFICFYVVERGKLRRIMSVHFSERVVIKSLNQNALIPVLSRSLIYDNGASQKGKGPAFTIRRTVIHLRRHYQRYGNEGYILQIDFKNYFGSIDHELAKRIIRNAFNDPKIIWLSELFIDAYYEHNRKQAAKEGKNPDEVRAVGLGLGSEMNQTIAVSYPNPFDHYIKEVLGIKGYVRYNDDSYLIHQSKEYLQYCYEEIKKICRELKIMPNEKKTHITKLSHGFTFLKTQFELSETGKIVRRPCREAITRERRKLKRQKGLLESGEMSFEDVRRSYASWRGSVKNKTARKSLYSMDCLFNRLFIKEWQEGGGLYGREEIEY